MTAKLRIFHAIFLIVTILIVSGCALTMEQFTKKYAGYTVVSKESRPVTIDVPVWTLYCVKPDKTVGCDAKSVGRITGNGYIYYSAYYDDVKVYFRDFSECDRKSCNAKGYQWERVHTGDTKQTFFQYIVMLKSPTGEVVEDMIRAEAKPIFDEIREGQVFPTAGLK